MGPHEPVISSFSFPRLFYESLYVPYLHEGSNMVTLSSSLSTAPSKRYIKKVYSLVFICSSKMASHLSYSFFREKHQSH